MYILLDVLVCSIAEYFMRCAVHWRARRASFPSKSFCSFLIKQEKQRGKRSVARAADWLNSFFFTVQNNQLSRLPYNIAGYMYSVRTLFALYFVQLDNNKKYMYLRLFKIIVPKEWFQSTIWLLYFQVQSPPSPPPSPPLLPSRYQFFYSWHSVFISLHLSAYSLANLSLLHILPTSNWLPIFPP